MQLQIEYFSNSCEGLVTNCLSIFEDTDLLKKIWSHEVRSPFSCVDYVEMFLKDTRELFETDEYKHFADSKAMVLLKTIADKIENYYHGDETCAYLFNQDKLLKDPEWIEIQNLSKEVSVELKSFVHRLRTEEIKYE